MTAPVALLASDLMIRTAVENAALQAGRPFRQLPSLDVDELSGLAGDTLLIVDLSHSDSTRLLGPDAPDSDLIPAGIAFGPHVHTEKLDAARARGFGKVLSRGGFLSRLPQLLAGSG
jgi:hypothetical protein